MNCHTGTHKVLEFLTFQQVLRIIKRAHLPRFYLFISSWHFLLRRQSKLKSFLSKINWAHASKILWLMTLVVPIVVALLTIWAQGHTTAGVTTSPGQKLSVFFSRRAFKRAAASLLCHHGKTGFGHIRGTGTWLILYYRRLFLCVWIELMWTLWICVC